METDQVYYHVPKHWRPELIVLSFVVSFLGAYTTTQLCIQAGSTKVTGRAIFWLALASVSFGGSGIWCMHFVAMLACDLGMRKNFTAVLTIATAISAIVGTFATLLLNVPPPERSNASTLSLAWHRVYGLLSRPTINKLFNSPLPYDSLEREESARDDSSFSQQYDARSDQLSSTMDSDSLIRDADMREVLTRTARGAKSQKYQINDLALALYNGSTLRVTVSGALLGLDVFFMHFLGMRAMSFDGKITYSTGFVILSYLEAWFTCIVALIYMPAESDLRRQVIFSTVAAIAVSGLHYIGMYAATFKTTTPPPYNSAENNYTLAASCAAIAVTTCFLSYAFLAHAVADHKIRLQGYIQTRKELWKATAERRAFERSNRLKSDFIATASHELRTPLYSISGYSELLQTTNLSAEQMAYVDLIKSATKALSLITDSVLDFSKLENDNLESQAKPTTVDLRKLVYDCVRQCYMRKDHRSPEVDLICIIDDQVPESCWIDEVYISRVVFNLCGNALKFTTNGYVILHLTLGENPQDMVLQCIDTGIGIPQANLEDIFKPFRQVDNDNTRKFHGTGLGLAISQQLVGKIGGTMAVKSSQDERDIEKGSCFTCMFPNMSPSDPYGTSGTANVTHLSPESVSRKSLQKSKKKHLTYLHRHKRCHPVLAAALSEEFQVHNIAIGNISRQSYNSQFSQRILTEIECLAGERMQRVFAGCSKDKMWYVCYDEEAASTIEFDIKSLREHDNVVLLRRPICVNRDLFDQLDGMDVQRSSKSFDLNSEISERVNPVLPVTRDRARDDSKTKTRSVTFDIPVNEESDDLPTPVLMDIVTTDSSILKDANQDPIELISLPDPNETTPVTAAGEDEQEEKKPCILLVEDNKVNSKLGMIMLKKCGMDAVAAENGQEAIDHVTAAPDKFSLILMDCQMPVMDGLTAIRHIRRWEASHGIQHHPIISLTANVSEAAERDCLAAGADKFLPKPLTMKNLKDEVCCRLGRAV